jgi:energy-coupling factor transporter ATP-binding protein EcfA2
MKTKIQPKQFSIEKDLRILFIGETGVGKSTLINMTVNILSGVDFEGKRRVAIPYTEKFQIIVDGKISKDSRRLPCNIKEFVGISSESSDMDGAADERRSQTTRPMLYGIKDSLTGKQITIVDTPGLNDTRGSTFDDQHIQSIVQAIFCVGGVHVVCIVHNATEARLKPATELALTRLMNMFTNTCLNNFIVCLTNSPKHIAPNCFGSFKHLKIPDSNIFNFENNCLVHPESYRDLSNKVFFEVHEDVEDTIDMNQKLWKQNSQAILKLLRLGNTFELLDTESVKDLFIKREASDKQIQVIADKIRLVEEKEIELQRQIAKVKEFNQKIQNTKNITSKVKVLDRIKKTVTEYRREKKYKSYSVAKSQKRSDNWHLGNYLGYGVLTVATFGGWWVSDKYHTIKHENEGRILEDYYDWVEVPYTVEIDDFVEREIEIEDPKKKILYLEAVQQGRVSQDIEGRIGKELNTMEKEKELFLRLLCYLISELEKNAAGNVITQNSMISQIDEEIKYCKKMLQNTKYQQQQCSDAVKRIRELEERRKRLLKGGEVIEIARSTLKAQPLNQMGDQFKSDMIQFNIIMREEEKNEESKLGELRKVFSSLSPWVINKDKPDEFYDATKENETRAEKMLRIFEQSMNIGEKIIEKWNK